ncbi:4319_t:CDS:2, partial [Paraglomus occultum]
MTWEQAKAKLCTLFPDEEERGRIRGKDLNPQVLKEIQRKVDRLDEMMMKRARISSEAVIPSLSYSN